MIKTKFHEEVKQHLSRYKKDVLNVHEMGISGNNGMKRRYEHILPDTLSRLNVIDPYRDSFFETKLANIDFHKCFHHLNSSQALCINLFYPLIVENRLDLIAGLLNLPEGEIVNPTFEFVSDLEQTERGKTNFDFYFEIVKKVNVYIELKYTEQKFGDVNISPVYKRKFKKTYLPLLAENPFIQDEYKMMSAFLKNYQIMRNLVHISDNSVVIFLYPEKNRKIHEQALRTMNKMVTKKGREHLLLLGMEDLLHHILRTLEHGRVKDHFERFKEKYLISS